MKKPSKDYHDYFIKDGKFIGRFEEMYKNVSDPWHIGNADDIKYDILLLLMKKINLQKGKKKIFDIGCGKGAFTARIQKTFPDADIMAVDISQTAIQKAMKDYGQLGIHFKVMDVQKDLETVTRKFDLVILSQLMWCVLPDFKKIVKNISDSILKQSGYLLVHQSFFIDPKQQKYGKKIVSTIQDMLKLIDMNAFEIIEQNRFTNYNSFSLFKK